MEVRILDKKEIDQALPLVLNAMDMSDTRLKGLILRKKICFWGCFREELLCGRIAVNQEGQLFLFFVEDQFRRIGIGRLLLDTVVQFFKENKKTDVLKANVVSEAKEAYLHMGFVESGKEQYRNKTVIFPMELHITLAPECKQTELIPVEAMKPEELENSAILLTKEEVNKEHRKRRGFIYIAVIFIVLGVSVSVTVGTHLTSTFVDWMKEKKNESMQPEIQNKKETKNQEEKREEKCEIIRSKNMMEIDAYVQNDLPYKVEDKKFIYQTDKKDKRLSFEVIYPQLTGLQNSQEERINKTIEECAKSSADLLKKEAAKDKKIYSNVKYKVAYMDQDFMSIVLEDHYDKGGKNGEYLDLRTLNINLTNGMVYALSDIVHLDPAFMNSLMGKLKDDYPSSPVLEDMSREELQKILSGDQMDARYWGEFYVRSGKIEIGITYHHSGALGTTRGWITTPFAIDEMEKYKTDSDFWNVMKSDH